MGQKRFASELHVSRSYLSEIENDKVQPSRKIVERVEVMERVGSVGSATVGEPSGGKYDEVRKVIDFLATASPEQRQLHDLFLEALKKRPADQSGEKES